MKKIFQTGFTILIIASSIVGAILPALNFEDVMKAHSNVNETILESLKNLFNYDIINFFKGGTDVLVTNINITFWSSIVAFIVCGTTLFTGFFLLYLTFNSKETHLVLTIFILVIAFIGIVAGTTAYIYYDTKLSEADFFNDLINFQGKELVKLPRP